MTLEATIICEVDNLRHWMRWCRRPWCYGLGPRQYLARQMVRYPAVFRLRVRS